MTPMQLNAAISLLNMGIKTWERAEQAKAEGKESFEVKVEDLQAIMDANDAKEDQILQMGDGQ